MSAIPFLETAATSYLLGSIPFGYLLVRLFTGEDVRATGSGNIGATNVARKSRVLGLLTLILDAGKGLAAVILARFWWNVPNRNLLLTVAAVCAIVGHLYPIWLRFHGGKGVATSLGAFALLTPKSILCMVGLFLVLALALRYVSLGSVAAAASFPLLAWAFHEYQEPVQLLLIALVSLLVIWKHRGNLGRLAEGTESRIGKRIGLGVGQK
ncbi:MAG: glycerol-3-phosphate 1-O-acyltransferase PlsY [Terriglobales bacterium]